MEPVVGVQPGWWALISGHEARMVGIEPVVGVQPEWVRSPRP